MGINPTEGEVPTKFTTQLGGDGWGWNGEWRNGWNSCVDAYTAIKQSGTETQEANLIAEQANAMPVGYRLISDKQVERLGVANHEIGQFALANPILQFPERLKNGRDELMSVYSDLKYRYNVKPDDAYPPKDTNPLNHPTQDLYEHWLAVANLYHTEDLRKAFYHGAGEHTPEELAGFRTKECSA